RTSAGVVLRGLNIALSRQSRSSGTCTTARCASPLPKLPTSAFCCASALNTVVLPAPGRPMIPTSKSAPGGAVRAVSSAPHVRKWQTRRVYGAHTGRNLQLGGPRRLLPPGSQAGRADQLLRQLLPDRRGRRELLSAHAAPQLRALGGTDARRLLVQRRGVPHAHPPGRAVRGRQAARGRRH